MLWAFSILSFPHVIASSCSRLAASDHCKTACAEKMVLDSTFEKLRSSTVFPLLNWDVLRGEEPPHVSLFLLVYLPRKRQTSCTTFAVQLVQCWGLQRLCCLYIKTEPLQHSRQTAVQCVCAVTVLDAISSQGLTAVFWRFLSGISGAGLVKVASWLR